MRRLAKTAFILFLSAMTAFCGCSGTRSILNGTMPPQITPVSTPTPRPTATPTPVVTVAPTPEPTPTLESMIWDYIDGMTVEEKIGQLAMFGFRGMDAPPQEFSDIVERYHVGNMILYGFNIDRNAPDGGFEGAKTLIQKLNGLNPSYIPRFYSIDVEGGSVCRFTWERELESAYSLGFSDAESAYDQFSYVGRELASIGINLDLAPVLDVSESPLMTFLEDRIISSDADTVSEIGCAMISGLHDGGCLAAAKHFPGHGGTNGDSHEVTPVVDKSTSELYAYDLVPFRSAVEAGVDFVLVAHISYPALDSNNIASMSNPIISGILRGEMGFDGVVISDDFRMRGLTARYSVGEAAVKFILAGGDMILCGPHYELQESIMQALYEAVGNGTISEDRLNASIYRILMAKYNAGIWSPRTALISQGGRS